MNPLKIVAVSLIVVGAVWLFYGGISYTRETYDVDVGPIEFSVSERRTIDLPVWAGVGAIAVGGLLLVIGRRKR